MGIEHARFSTLAGGLSRHRPFTFRSGFSYDFRTTDPGLGGWLISINTPTPPSPVPPLPPARIDFFQYGGCSTLVALIVPSAAWCWRMPRTSRAFLPTQRSATVPPLNLFIVHEYGCR